MGHSPSKRHEEQSPSLVDDILSKLASTKLKSRHRSLLQQTLSTPSITNTCHNLTHAPTDNLTHPQAHNWTTPYIQYLQTNNPHQMLTKLGWLRLPDIP